MPGNSRERWRFLLVLLLAVVGGAGCRLFQPPAQPQQPSADATPADGGKQSGLIRVYFTTPDDNPQRAGNIADKLAGYIDQTQDTLDVAAFELDNEVVTAALLRATERGVKVRLVTDADYADETGPRRLKAAGVPVV